LPVAFEGPPNELAGLSMFLEEQRAAVLRKLDGLSDAQAIEHPTASEFCMLTLVKHFAYVERRLTAARALVRPLSLRVHAVSQGAVSNPMSPLRWTDRAARWSFSTDSAAPVVTGATRRENDGPRARWTRSGDESS
jgi:DNA-binding transcriptional ArsR family regulator